MLRNYLKIAWRNLARNKVYSFINIGGLAVGMAVAMLIGLWVWDELTFDHSFPNHDRLAQVLVTQTVNGEITTSPAVAIPLAEKLRADYNSDIKRMALVFPAFPHVLDAGDRKLTQPGVWAQPDLPEMLCFNMLRGQRNALADPSSVLLAQSLATALFGTADPIGQPLKMDNQTYFKVAGVFEDFPRNTTFYGTKLFLPWATAVTSLSWLREAGQQWDTQFWHLFVELNDQVEVGKLNARIRAIQQPFMPKSKPDVQLHPMNNWHLFGEFKQGQAVGGRISIVWLFGIIGGVVLLLACINFMNLSTARSQKRAKEVGIRKAVGSLRSQLMGQFFGESLLVTLLASLLAILLVYGLLPIFNQLTDKAVVIPWSNTLFWGSVLGCSLLTALVAGSYPALYLSGFSPVAVLTGMVAGKQSGRSAISPRQVLVVVQFTVSITLILGTVIVFRQIRYAQNRPVGYTRAGLIAIQKNTPDLFQAPYNALRADLIQTRAATDMACSSVPATETPAGTRDFTWKGKAPGSASALLQTVGVTYDYGRTMGWKILAGRDFLRSFSSDSGAVILNETAAKLTGFRQPVGELIRWEGKTHRIVGLVKDLVMESPYQPVQPCLFVLDYAQDNFILVRLNPALPVRDALAKIEPVFRKYNPSAPFDYKFVDTEYARKFSDDEQVSRLASVFAILAVFISCLGIFGLASFMAEQRTKEIGVRKVLGASVIGLWGLLTKDFIRLVLIAFGIATPVAWCFFNNWLRQYAYHTDLAWWIFAASGAGAVLVTLLTVSVQSVKAALTNPVKSLRSE